MENLLRGALGNAATAALLASAVALLGRPLQRTPALRHALWMLVLIKLVTPPVWTVPVAWLPRTSSAGPTTLGDSLPGGIRAELDRGKDRLVFEERDEGAPPVEEFPLGRLVAETLVAEDGAEAPTGSGHAVGWVAVVGGVWLVGSLIAMGVAVGRIVRFQRALRFAVPASESDAAQVEGLADRLGLRRPPSVWSIAGAVSPMVWAVGARPRLLLPEELWRRLDKEQRATLLAHELAHLKRGDHWVRGLELLATAFYWWFPVVWWARGALRDAEEQCCDAWVVWAFPDRARTYAEALIETVDFLSPGTPAAATSAAGLGHVRQLKRRLIMIMQAKTPRSLSTRGLLIVLGLAGTLLPMAPTWAQVPEAQAVGEGYVDVFLQDQDPKLGDEAQARYDKDLDTLILMAQGASPELRADTLEVVLRSKDEGDEALKKAVKELQEQLERLGTPGDAESRAKQKKAIDEATRKLQGILKSQAAARTLSDVEVRIKERKAEKDEAAARAEADARRAEAAKLNAEVKALKDKAMAKQAELKEITAQLRSAQGRLAKLLGEATHQVRYSVVRPVETLEVVPYKPGEVKVRTQLRNRTLMVRPVDPSKAQTVLKTESSAPKSDPEQRLKELEKKLDELREELAKLKKSR